MITIKRVLAATDFSEFGGIAIRYACEIAQAFTAELHLLHVTEPPLAAYSEFVYGHLTLPEVENELSKQALAKLDEFPEPPWRDKLTVVRTATSGTAFTEIVRYAKEEDVDLIVVGTHGRGAIAHILLGSTAERVVRCAPCPVLTVRQQQHQFVMP